MSRRYSPLRVGRRRGKIEGKSFAKQRLLEVERARLRDSAWGIPEALHAAVDEFAGHAPHAQHDDITLLVVVRESAERLGDP